MKKAGVFCFYGLVVTISNMERKCRNCRYFKWVMVPVLDYGERTKITQERQPNWDTLTIGRHVTDNRNWELKKSDVWVHSTASPPAGGSWRRHKGPADHGY